jgi:hypothetical protein
VAATTVAILVVATSRVYLMIRGVSHIVSAAMITVPRWLSARFA